MARAPRPRVKPDACFLNIPYDDKFENLYLAYIVGLTAHGLVPTATLGVPRDARRLDRIFKLIRECRYSVHDISRIQLDPRPPRAPRFNMPFELGLAVAWTKLNPQRHSWVGCDEIPHRAVRSISDLAGTDFHTHHGTVSGVLAALCNAFVGRTPRPTVPRMKTVYRQLRRAIPELKANAGANSLFEARVFNDLVVAARRLWEQLP